jgi:hypothetical protein
MRSALAIVIVLAASSAAADNAKLIDAVHRAGFANVKVLASSEELVVLATTNDKGAADGGVIVATPTGDRVTHLRAADPPIAARGAAVRRFLGEAGLVELDIEVGGPLGAPASHHRYVVRAATLEPACDFDGPYDSGQFFMAQHFDTKVTVAKKATRPLTFVVETRRSKTQDGVTRREREVVRYELGSTGTCTRTPLK